MSRPYLGIDNGVTGSLGFIPLYAEPTLMPMPVRKELNYTKKKGWISRVDYIKLRAILAQVVTLESCNTLVLLERPMVNPGRFKATISALRAMEATLIAIEQDGLPYRYVDSKEWQKVMLPSGLKGDELKEASREVGRRLWPKLSTKTDFDSLLMAEWARRNAL